MVVKIAYTGTLPDGSEFDSSKGGDPLEFMVGSGQMIPKFEENLMGLRKGDKKTFTIAAADAYGERDEAMMMEVPLTAFPADLKLAVGMQLGTTASSGEQMVVTVSELKKDVAVIDYNHPARGQGPHVRNRSGRRAETHQGRAVGAESAKRAGRSVGARCCHCAEGRREAAFGFISFCVAPPTIRWRPAARRRR